MKRQKQKGFEGGERNAFSMLADKDGNIIIPSFSELLMYTQTGRIEWTPLERLSYASGSASAEIYREKIVFNWSNIHVNGVRKQRYEIVLPGYKSVQKESINDSGARELRNVICKNRVEQPKIKTTISFDVPSVTSKDKWNYEEPLGHRTKNKKHGWFT